MEAYGEWIDGVEPTLTGMSTNASSIHGHGGPVMVAMSGGVDSSVAAALLLEAGYEVVGVTMKLWGGPNRHRVFARSPMSMTLVGSLIGSVSSTMSSISATTSNAMLLPRMSLTTRRVELRTRASSAIDISSSIVCCAGPTHSGSQLLPTGHHARVVATDDGPRIGRGADTAKDQSYVLHMLDEAVLRRLLLPLGAMTKTEVRKDRRRPGPSHRRQA